LEYCEGLQFNDLHKFFEAQYEELDEIIVDEVAERARTLRGRSFGTYQKLLKHTRLKEHPSKYPDTRGMISKPLCQP
jgi:starvation-inducible DNA-binding protein